MSKIAIVTDSNSGIKLTDQNEDLYVLPMPFIINGEEYFEEISLSQEKFYEKLAQNADISTSQPSPYQVTEMWENALKTHDEVIYIPMSSGLSQSCHNAIEIAKNYPSVTVVDNQRISVTQKASIYEALNMAKEGYTPSQIKEYLETTKLDSSIYITVNTLKYLKKGGRITPAVALIGTMLNIKPILQIHGEKLDSFAKALSMGQAKAKMIAAVKKDLETVFKDYYQKGEMEIDIAHTDNEEEAEKFKAEVEKAIPNIKVKNIDPLSLSVSCHIGPGSLAIAAARVTK